VVVERRCKTASGGGHRPDRWDYLGGAVCVYGMAFSMYGSEAGRGIATQLKGERASLHPLWG
jgi:hypothetical protein